MSADTGSENEMNDDQDPYESQASYTCDRCWGEGFIVECCDDLCIGAGECMHGDGNVTCPECNGEGEIYPEDYA